MIARASILSARNFGPGGPGSAARPGFAPSGRRGEGAASVQPGVRAQGEGALGAAAALDGVIGDHAVEEAVAGAGVGGAKVAPRRPRS